MQLRLAWKRYSPLFARIAERVWKYRGLSRCKRCVDENALVRDSQQAILEIAFAHLHSRFRTYRPLFARPVLAARKSQSLHRRPTALRCRPIRKVMDA